MVVMITVDQVPAARRPLRTTLLTLLTLVVVATPVCAVALMALIDWTGCLLECGAPDHRAAAICAGVVLALLGFPVTVGVATWQGRHRLGTGVLAAAAALSLLSVPLLGLSG